MSIDLQKQLAQAVKPLAWRPEILDFSLEKDRVRLGELFEQGAVRTVSDDFEEQLRELYAYQEPSRVFSPDFAEGMRNWIAEKVRQLPLWQQGRWVYYPWRSGLAHVLESEPHFRIRTSRNRNLITSAEQDKFAAAAVGIAGLSVGNSVALSIVLQGGARHLRLADFDRLALSNTNRIRTSSVELGCNKVEMTARQIFEIDPYAEVELFTDGLTPDNIARFFGESRKLDVVIDEVDNLAVKCLIREYASRLRLPVVMAADNGDNAVVDVERYDIDPQPPFFHGRMGEVSYEQLRGLDKMGIGRLIAKHVGPENVRPRMRSSLFEMGKSIVSWPQLGGAALLNGCAVAYSVRAIICGQPLVDNRALVSLDMILSPVEPTPAESEAEKRAIQDFAAKFGI